MKKFNLFKNKNKKKSIVLILSLLLVLGIFITCKAKDVSFSYLLNNTINAFFNPKQVVEEKEDIPLENIINKMYVTMLDEGMSVIATSNPDTMVNAIYQIKEES